MTSTTLLTIASACTAIGIAITQQIKTPEPAATTTVVHGTAPVTADADRFSTAFAELHVDGVHATTPTAELHERDLAAFRWHERLTDARREVRFREQMAATTGTPVNRRSSREIVAAERQKLAQQRQRRAVLKQRASRIRTQREEESIFTRSRAFRQHGSAYPATQLNRNLRRTYGRTTRF